jgi:hypothetical protein
VRAPEWIALKAKSRLGGRLSLDDQMKRDFSGRCSCAGRPCSSGNFVGDYARAAKKKPRRSGALYAQRSNWLGSGRSDPTLRSVHAPRASKLPSTGDRWVTEPLSAHQEFRRTGRRRAMGDVNGRSRAELSATSLPAGASWKPPPQASPASSLRDIDSRRRDSPTSPAGAS